MSQIKVIALDLDGTLLNSEKKISPRNLAAIRAAQEKGVKVVLTTGRPLKAMDFLLQEIGTAGLSDEYTITFNGGLVQKNTGEIIAKTVFSRDDVVRIYEETEALGLPLDAISEGNVYKLVSDQESLYPLYNPYLNFIPVSIEDLSSQISYNKCVTAFQQDYLDGAIPKISPELRERFEIFKSRDMLLEALVEYLGIDASQVMACGDEANDASMLKWAGLGIAMANAVDEVKEIATLVSDYTNDEDAVGRAIEEYVLKEGQ